jgi:cell division protein FtsB
VNLKQKIFLFVIILAFFNLLLIIIFGSNGFVDLISLKKEVTILKEKNEGLARENLSLYREIDRLKNDLDFIESVARKELGVVRKDELVFEFKTPGASKKRKTGKRRIQVEK